jgi:hypothetical protein
MISLEEKIREYELTGEYKGFHELLSHEQAHMTHLTLTDGQRDISASGTFTNEALKRIFDKIDFYHAN